MLVRPHRPYGLEGQQVAASAQVGVAMLAFQSEKDELALPPGQVGRDAPLGILYPARGLDPIVPGAEHPALAGSRLKVQKGAVSVGRRSDEIGVQPIPFGSEGDVAAGTHLRRAIGQPEIQSCDAAPEIGVVVIAGQSRYSDLGVRSATQLPEILQPGQPHRLATAEQQRIAAGSRALHPDLVGGSSQRERQRGIERETGSGEALGAEVALVDQRVLGFGESVEVPAVQVANLLAELAHVESYPAGKAGPVDVAFLDSHLVVLKRQENFGVGIGIQSRLEGELELPRNSPPPAYSFLGDQSDVTGR